jgi:hypothetical protein
MVRKLAWLIGLWTASVVGVGGAALLMRAVIPH